jgi:hypothetical protein
MLSRGGAVGPTVELPEVSQKYVAIH